MNEEILHFLLRYDHALGKLVEVVEFGTDADKAIEAYGALEAKYRENARMDIVLVGSDSLDTIKITHCNYFDDGRTLDEIEEYLRGIPNQLVTA